MEGDHTAELFAGVDALLAQAAAVLPDAGERRRLREAAHLSPSQVATALKTSPELVESWESGLVEPSGPQRAAYARLLKGLLARERAQDEDAGSSSPPPAPRPREQAPPPRSTTPAPRRRATTAPSPGPHRGSSQAPGEHFPAGPLSVLDGADTLTAHLADGTTLPCPASTMVGVLHWALRSGIGQPRLATHGRPADPLIVLTPPAAHHLGLPADLEDRAGLRLPAHHPVIEAVTADGWKLTHRGFGPWARIYQRPTGRQRRSVQLAVTGWGALSTGSWNPPAGLTPQELARWLGIYAERVLTPCGSTAVCGQELMTALRPPTRAVRAASGTWQQGNNQAALWNPVDPAPPEAPDAHPLAQDRAPHDALDEEAWDWHRHPTADEADFFPHVVGLDINLAFVSAAGGLVTGLNTPPEHVTHPVFDKKTPGAWYCDLSHITLDPRLPSPFTPTGLPPTGPAWYATPTLAYAEELGATVQPAEAYLRLEHSTYLTPWYKHLRNAYMATMNDLGITESMNQADYLTAMRTLPRQDPFLLSLLAAIKATGKGGIGKLRAGPHDPRRAPHDPWPALSTPTWRPDIRAALISRARTNMHRKMLRTAQETGRYPLAVLSDCAVYAADRPTALDAVPQGDDGNGVSGTFRLGVNPGLVKEEGVQSMAWLFTARRDGTNPARHIKSTSMP